MRESFQNIPVHPCPAGRTDQPDLSQLHTETSALRKQAETAPIGNRSRSQAHPGIPTLQRSSADTKDADDSPFVPQVLGLAVQTPSPQSTFHSYDPVHIHLGPALPYRTQAPPVCHHPDDI